MVLATTDVPRSTWSLSRSHRQSIIGTKVPREPPMPPPPHRVNPPDSSNDEIDGVLKTRDENAKPSSRFTSSVNMVTCNPWYLWCGRKGCDRLDVADKLEWMSHPLSGYLLKVFFDAFELGRVWGCIILERYIQPDNGYCYAHGYGLPPGFPDVHSLGLIRASADGFWGPEKTLPAEVLARGTLLSVLTRSRMKKDTLKLKQSSRKRSSSMPRFLKSFMGASTLRKISTFYLNPSMSCSARISLLTSPSTAMMRMSVVSTPFP